MGESKSISAKLMKEDLGRISEWTSFTRNIEPIALAKLDVDRPQQSRAMDISRSTGESEPLLDYAVVTVILAVASTILESILDACEKRKLPLSSNLDKENFLDFVSGSKEYSVDELFKDRTFRDAFSGKTEDIYQQEALRIYTALLFTRDTFTIFFNLLPTLSRIQKLLTLQSVLLSESSHCSGKSHPAAIALQKARSEGLVPWKENQGALEDGPAVKLFQRLQPLMTEGYPVPPDFASFSQNYPSWDAFWQIAAWKAVRMEKAIEAVTRELLIEAWKCPEKPLLPAPPDPDMPLEPERLWDWVTEKEITKPGLPRGGIRPFAYGSGHPVAEILWDPVWDAEHERRSYTEEIPLTFPKDLHTFRCGIPVDVKKVREIIDHPWRWAAEEDLPDFSGLWGGFSRETERLFSGKETVGQTSEGKPITWKDIRSGAESIYKRGIGMLDHLAGVQEYYRPLRAIDPAEWRDVAERLKEENFPERSPVGN